MANLTYCIIEKSCNKFLIGKTYWKSIILPSILYGTNIINLSEEDIKVLQIIENNVYRSILNAPPSRAIYAPNVISVNRLSNMTPRLRALIDRAILLLYLH